MSRTRGLFGLLGRRRGRKPPTKGRGWPRFTRCSYCKGTEIYEGPTGGLCVNITCAQCGANFNIGVMPGGPYLIDNLGPPTKEPWASRTYET